MLALPVPRGAVSAALIDALAANPGSLRDLPMAPIADPLADEDLQLALYLCYELHYRGAPGVDERWEWDPGLLALRARLERRFEDGLLAALGRARRAPSTPDDTDLALRAIAEADDGPASRCGSSATRRRWHVREFAMHRSAYQLKEADPHSWALPRLSGPPKAALVEIQADEYGGGRADRIHAELFGPAMEGLELDRRYGAYLEHIPGVTLATVNLMSLFGLHRRLRGAIVGHLALFEMTSSIPNARYARGLRRLGFDDPTVAFFDEHVEADAVHENIAAVDLAGGLVRQEPAQGRQSLGSARAVAAGRALGRARARALGGRRELAARAGQPADGGRRALTAAAPVPASTPPFLEPRRRAEAHELVAAIAERADARAPAAAQGDRLAPHGDLAPVLVAQHEGPADEQGPVAIGRDHGRVAQVSHWRANVAGSRHVADLGRVRRAVCEGAGRQRSRHRACGSSGR